ncbi:MAG: metal-dependent hydrolase [Methanomicrobiales archaeon]|nr:metal-dependent hydrolase [Methanomicrobiales archaeon]
MDSLTHAFVVMLASPETLSGISLFTLVLGAVIPDIDIFFKPLSDRYPELYMFTHGGITHSITGAVAMAPLALTGIYLAGSAGAFPSAGQGFYLVVPGICFIIGTFTHLILDALAYPGIPLFYPFSPRKYTAGVFPGPSLVLFAASLIFALITLPGYGGAALNLAYAAFALLFVLASIAIAVIVQGRNNGMAIPTLNPARWFVLKEDEQQYILSSFNLFSGPGPEKIFPKYTNTTPRDIQDLTRNPEYQRLRFYSYIITATRDGDHVVFSDPLRSDRIIYYPPFYTRLILPAPE